MEITFLLPILVSSVGLYLLIRLRAFFIIHPIRTAAEVGRALKDRKSRRSFLLALAGTLGVGNIFGVAAGIMIGGAGSLFWLFISSAFAMAIKYAETLLVFDAKNSRGGTAAIIAETFGEIGSFLSPIYALLTVILALFMGAAMQSGAVVDILDGTLEIPPIISAVVLLLLLIPALLGGVNRIERITEIIIPLTTIIYIIMCFVSILVNVDRLGTVINSMIISAFSFRAALGGGLSFLAVKEGFARGILSNEAGVGSSAMAHARSGEHDPHVGGLFAMCEVGFDSVILCSLTGLVILTSVDNPDKFSSPMSLVYAAFYGTLGKGAVYVLIPVILAFAYATIICWYFYGLEYSASYFRRLKTVFPLLFILSIFLPIILGDVAMLSVIDICLLLMSFMTLSVIIKRSNKILSLSKKDPG